MVAEQLVWARTTGADEGIERGGKRGQIIAPRLGHDQNARVVVWCRTVEDDDILIGRDDDSPGSTDLPQNVGVAGSLYMQLAGAPGIVTGAAQQPAQFRREIVIEEEARHLAQRAVKKARLRAMRSSISARFRS